MEKFELAHHQSKILDQIFCNACQKPIVAAFIDFEWRKISHFSVRKKNIYAKLTSVHVFLLVSLILFFYSRNMPFFSSLPATKIT